MIFIENWKSFAVEEDKLDTQPLGHLFDDCVNTLMSALSGQQTCCVAVIKLLLGEQLENRDSCYLVHLLALHLVHSRGSKNSMFNYIG